WQGFFMPKGTPAAIVQRLHDATVAVMSDPAVQERLRQSGNDPVAPERQAPDYLQKLVERAVKDWVEPIRARGRPADWAGAEEGWGVGNPPLQSFRFMLAASLPSVDDRVCAQMERWWKREAQRPGGPDVDDELELRRLRNRQVGWLGPLQDPPRIDARLAIGV